MDRKKLIKEIFDERFDKEQMYNSIIMKMEKDKKAKLRNNLIKFATLPICAMLIISFILVRQDTRKITNENDKLPIVENQEVSIIINKIEMLGMAMLDARVENITNETFEVVEGIVVPKDLDKFDAYKLLIKGDNSKEYNKLANYVYSYINTETNRSSLHIVAIKKKKILQTINSHLFRGL